MGRSSRWLLPLVCAATLAVPAAVAHAQAPEVARGVELYLSADFEGAIDALEGALRTRTLAVSDVEIALDRLAAANSAIGDHAGTDASLGRLAVVAPGHLFDVDVPTELSARFVEIMRTTPSIGLRIEAVPGAAPRAVVEDDPWHAVLDTSLSCDEASGACEAVAFGPGRVELGRARLAGTSPASPPVASEGGGVDPLVVGLAVGGGVLALALAIGIGVGVASAGGGSSGGSIQLGMPVIHW